MATHTAHERPLPLPHRPRRRCCRDMAARVCTPRVRVRWRGSKRRCTRAFFYGERAALAKRRACPVPWRTGANGGAGDHAAIFSCHHRPLSSNRISGGSQMGPCRQLKIYYQRCLESVQVAEKRSSNDQNSMHRGGSSSGVPLRHRGLPPPWSTTPVVQSLKSSSLTKWVRDRTRRRSARRRCPQVTGRREYPAAAGPSERDHADGPRRRRRCDVTVPTRLATPLQRCTTYIACVATHAHTPAIGLVLTPTTGPRRRG